MPKPIKIDLPYPSLTGITPDIKTASVLAPTYAGVHGELTATLQYIYHYFNFVKEFDEKTAETLMGIAIAEMEHIEILGNLLVKLGVDPVYTHFPPCRTEYYSTRAVSYSKTPVKMLLDDISSEMVAINEYNSVIDKIDNEKVIQIVSRIILDEQLHVTVLKDLAKQYLINC